MRKHPPITNFKTGNVSPKSIPALLTLDLQIYGKFTKVEGLL